MERDALPVAVVGAGPYALALSAHLRAAGVEAQLFGDVMGFWEEMPAGMLLRSYRSASNIRDPLGELNLERFGSERGVPVPTPVPLEDFVEYGRWFKETAGAKVDPRRVSRLAREGDLFRLELDDGDSVMAQRVVVGAGIAPFAWSPPLFSSLPPSLVTHSSVHREFSRFRELDILVIGRGQSALEVAVLAAEAGAHVRIVVRGDRLYFLRGDNLYSHSGAFRELFYPALGVGPPGLNWLMGMPDLYRRLPRGLREPMARRAIRPAGGAWIRPRLARVDVTLGANVVRAVETGSRLEVALDNGEKSTVDHLILGTGYRVDVQRYAFLDASLTSEIATVGGFPRLSPSLESSVRRLHFVGAPAAGSLGPGMRFVSHSGSAAAAITRSVLSDSSALRHASARQVASVSDVAQVENG